MQDLPPAQGYAPIQWRRNLPSRGFRPKVFLLIFGSIVGYGWYKTVGAIHERRELAREKMWTRIHLTPLLVAEEDRQYVRRRFADDAREKELMGSVERGQGFHWIS